MDIMNLVANKDLMMDGVGGRGYIAVKHMLLQCGDTVQAR